MANNMRPIGKGAGDFILKRFIIAFVITFVICYIGSKYGDTYIGTRNDIWTCVDSATKTSDITLICKKKR
jgi:hypothetical protein